MHAPRDPVTVLILAISTIALLIVSINGFRAATIRRRLQQLPDDPADLIARVESMAMPNGIDGMGTLLRFTDLGDGSRGARRVEFDVEIALPERTPYKVHQTGMVPASVVSRLAPGLTFPVRVDTTDPNRVLLLWGVAKAGTGAPPG